MAKRKRITTEEADDEQTPKTARTTRGSTNPNSTEPNGHRYTPIKRQSLSINGAGEDEIQKSESEVEEADETDETDGALGGFDGAFEGTPKRLMKSANWNGTPSKSLLSKKHFSTPSKSAGRQEVSETPCIVRNADRSARRKSARNLIEQVILGNAGDHEEDEEELAGHIYGSDEDEQAGEDADGPPDETSAPVTPSKRGRPKGSKNQRRSPTPPEDLTAHEKYFFHNRGGRAKTSNNNLSSLALLDHEEYFNRARNIKDPHTDSISFLESLHTDDFDQWHFQLSQQFNICVYGWGSKKSLLMKFADHVYKSQVDNQKSKIVVVNGYVDSLTIKDILNTVAKAVVDGNHKLGAQPAEMLETLIILLEENKTMDITLIIHSIDWPTLRRPAVQTILSRLSSHPRIHLIASADHPSFPLLWDSSLRSTYNFLFHDCTTFQPYTREIDVVDEVHQLLGRSGRRVGGKEGVSFVLKSLPENAKKLFAVLIGEQLASMDNEPSGLAAGDDDYDKAMTKHNDPGVEYRTLYKKAVEEFICSNDMAFRTLLKEFHDHELIQSRKDSLGTEILSVPFRKEELETILEDILS